MSETLLLRLEGTLQSWGVRSHWEIRDTSDAPTKSGLVGLIGCALGFAKHDERLRTISETLQLGVRIDLPGTVLDDYHTTGGGHYSDIQHIPGHSRYTDEPYLGGVPSAAVNNGRTLIKLTSASGTIETDVSHRHYLMDASFVAAMQGGSPEEMQAIAAALNNPVWPYYLGRRCCVPTKPVFIGLSDAPDLTTALTDATPHWNARWPMRALIECAPHHGYRQYDNIENTRRRVFGPRHIQEVWLQGPSASTTAVDTFGD